MKITHRLSSAPVLILAIASLAGAGLPLAAEDSAKPDDTVIKVRSKDSLLHLGSLDSYDITESGKQAARNVLNMIEKGDRASAQRAIDIYKRIIPDENFGGEYTALQWLMECELATPAERSDKFLSDPYIKSFYDLLAKDNWKYFLEFIRNKYHLDEPVGGNKDREVKRRSRFMEDFILFANPRRETWEKSSKMIAALNLQPGQKVADIGSGPGFFSFKFAQIVGPTGKVYAIDNNDDHLTYLRETIQHLKVPNVVPTMSNPGDLGVPEKVDLVFMCSLYHNLYAMLSDEERDQMIDSIKSILKPGGRVVIADNGPVDGNLPYHGPYINRELIIPQFHFLGFDYVNSYQFIPQRYMLVFTMRPDAKPPGVPWPPTPKLEIPPGGLIVTDIDKLPPTPGVSEIADGDPTKIRVLSHRSMMRQLMSGNLPAFSKSGLEAAELLWNGLKDKDRAKIQQAHDKFQLLLPRERIGDEYSALQWFAEYALAADSEKDKLVADPLNRDYVDFFAGNNFERLILYLKNKYLLGDLKQKTDDLAKEEEDRLKKLGLVPDDKTQVKRTADARALTATGNIDKGSPARPTTQDAPLDEADSPPQPYPLLPLDVDLDTLIEWNEFMAYTNPRREEWEKTTPMLNFFGVEKGQSVADVGCGSGFTTFRLSKLVGDAGKVYALEIVRDELVNVNRGAEKAGLHNIQTVLSKENDCTLPENSLDMALLGSLYHAIYVLSIEYVKDGFIESLKKAIKPGGHLIVVDNMPLSDKEGGYYGPRIAKEMVMAQLAHYGFRFTSYAQFVPQRYVMIFTVDKPIPAPPAR